MTDFLLYKTDHSRRIVAQIVNDGKHLSKDDDKYKIVELIKISDNHRGLKLSALTELYPLPSGKKVGEQADD